MEYGEVRRQRARSRTVLAELTASFLRLVGEPVESRPTVRCLSHADALALIVDARSVVDDPELRGYSAESLVETLVTSGILHPLELESANRPISIYLVGPQTRGSVDPIEILEAMQPAGVICYFTAMQFYGLTTQIASHHHIARLVRRSFSKSVERQAPRRTSAVEGTSPRQRDPLGTLLFTYQSQPYYRTDRGAHTIAGIQLRNLNDKTIARITTREQTLLDTLHRPLSCGGPSVVWEAWSRGVSELDASILADHLRTLQDSRLLRRVGYMLQSQDYSAPKVLGEILDDARQQAQKLDDEESIPLLPGIPGTQLDSHWRLRLP